MFRRNPRDGGDDPLHIGDADHFLAPGRRLQPLPGAGLVDQVDGLVGHVAIGDMACGKLGGGLQRLIGVAQLVMRLEAALEAPENAVGGGHIRLFDIDFLEAARQRPILVEDAAVFLVSGRADTAQMGRSQHRLEQVGGIHDATRGGAGADDGMYFVDEQYRLRLFGEFAEQGLEALFEIAAVLGAGEQGAEVE